MGAKRCLIFLNIYIYINIYFLNIYKYIFIFIYFFYIYIYTYIYIYISIYLSFYLSIYLSIYLNLSIYIYSVLHSALHIPASWPWYGVQQASATRCQQQRVQWFQAKWEYHLLYFAEHSTVNAVHKSRVKTSTRIDFLRIWRLKHLLLRSLKVWLCKALPFIWLVTAMFVSKNPKIKNHT